MSENLLRLIPCVPTYRPTAIQRQQVLTRCQQFTRSPSLLRLKETTAPHFIDPGANLRMIACPYCHHELAREWWQAAMDHAFALDFGDLGVVVPCCTRATSLNDLCYDWSAGFACFMVEMNESLPSIFDEQDALETALGCGIRWIWSHY